MNALVHTRRWSHVTRLAKWLVAAVAVVGPSLVIAQTPGQLPLLVGTGPAGVNFSVPVQTLLFFTALSFLPAVLLMMTGFTRIVIVLSLLRQALGTQSSPPNQVIVGLSLFLTFFVMGPTLDKVYNDAYLPYSKNAMPFEQALDKAGKPHELWVLQGGRHCVSETQEGWRRLTDFLVKSL